MKTRRHPVALALAAVAALLIPYLVYEFSRPDPADENRLEQHLALYATGQQANTILLAARSATAALDTWCADNKLADPSLVTAEHVGTRERPITDAQRTILRIGLGEPVKYRHVRLRCGNKILSEAENWYVPARLTPDMRDTLARDPSAPFGAVVAPLRPYRHTVETRWRWPLLPGNWQRMNTLELRRWVGLNPDAAIPDQKRELFDITAVVHRGADDQPFSYVIERYKWDLVGFRARP